MLKNLVCLIFVAVLLVGCIPGVPGGKGDSSQPSNLPSNMKINGSELEVSLNITVQEAPKDTIAGFSKDIISEMPAIIKAAPANVKTIRVDGYMDAQNMYGEIKSSKMISATISKTHAETVDWSSVTPVTLDETCKAGNGKLFVNPGLK